MKSQTVTLPAFLASALVDGDTSGLECTCPGRVAGGFICGAVGAGSSIPVCGEKPTHVGPHEDWRSDRRSTWSHVGDCDFRWLAEALAYVAPGDVVSTANCECDCGASEDTITRRKRVHTDECASHEPADSYFSWGCDLPGFLLGADMLDYVVLYPEGT